MRSAIVDKVVILARGLGTRMRRPDDAAAIDDRQAAIAETGIKALIPIGRPFLDYVLTVLAETGYRRVCLVVAPEHDVIRDYYGRQVQPQHLTVEYAIQEQPRGTADAVLAAEAFAADEPVVVLNSDNYYPAEALHALRSVDGPAVALFDRESMLRGSNIAEDRLRQFAVAQIDDQGFLVRILEKPDAATLASLPQPIRLGMNCWRFDPAIFAACRAIKPSARGELELPDAVQYAMDVLGQRFRAVTIHAPVLDLSSRKDIAAVAARLSGREVRF
jgi:glucose-1-phosphate thymidylyltransferase